LEVVRCMEKEGKGLRRLSIYRYNESSQMMETGVNVHHEYYNDCSREGYNVCIS
jgi:hypothetical protein